MADETLFENEIEEDIVEIDEEDGDEEDGDEEVDEEQELYDEVDDDEEDEEVDEDEEEDDILDELDDMLDDYDEEKEEKKEEIVETRTTFNILTKYEKNFLLGFRTQQIINGSCILIDIDKVDNKTPYGIALEELNQKVIPFKVKRTLPNGKIEIWDLDELIIYD